MTMHYDFPLPNTMEYTIGGNLYILGTAIDGPVMQPTRIRSYEQAKEVFGDEAKGTLVRAFKEAYDINSKISIYLMRITGKSATLKIAGFYDKDAIDIMSFRTMYGGDIYNSISVSIDHRIDENENLLVFEFPERTVVYNLDAHDNMGHLVKHINDDARAGLHSVMAFTSNLWWPADSIITAFPDTLQFSGGEDGVNVTRDDLYIALDSALNLLIGRVIDIIVLADMYVDDVHPVAIYGQGVYGSAVYASTRDYLQLVDSANDNQVVSYHERLIDFCREQMSLGYICHGVIGLRPLDTVPDTIDEDDSYILRLLNATVFRDRYGIMRYKNGRWMDKGSYISIVGFEPIFRIGTDEEYYGSGAAVYGAFLTGNFDTTSNKPIAVEKLRYEFSDETLAQLSKLGIVTLRNSVRNGMVVTSGVTAAHWENELHNVANVRMVQLTVSHMNDVTQTIYESEIDPSIRKVFTEDKVKARLDQLKRDRILTGYDYSVVYDTTLEHGVISLTLQSKYTVEGVGTSASINYTGVDSGV